MLFSDTYRTLGNNGEILYKSKGSKFYAYAIAVSNEQEIKQQLENLKTQWPDATHHCYAWRLGAAKTAFRINDDGEPSGSAGRPIFKYIQNNDLTNILVVVVRYFGGTLLGVPGLIEAYGESAKLAISQAEIIDKTIDDIYLLQFNYGLESEAYKLVKQSGAALVNQQQQEQVTLELRMPRSKTEKFLSLAKDYHQLTVKYLRTE